MANGKTWKRIDNVSVYDEHRLNNLVKKTKGMTRYGNRARTGIMLSVDNAEYIAKLSEKNGMTVSETINELIEKSRKS
jgi:macrodomain Ter protein organizer (MatP/YcbG family)